MNKIQILNDKDLNNENICDFGLVEKEIKREEGVGESISKI